MNEGTNETKLQILFMSVKEKNHMIISVDEEKPLTKFNILHDKISEETRNRKNITNYIKGLYGKTIANIIVNGENQIISSKVSNRTRVSISSLFFNIVLELLARGRKQEKGIKGI
jgi:hypothetical protein